MDDVRNQSKESQITRKISPLLLVLAMFLTTIAPRFDSLIAQDIIAVFSNEKFDIAEFRAQASFMNNCELFWTILWINP